MYVIKNSIWSIHLIYIHKYTETGCWIPFSLFFLLFQTITVHTNHCIYMHMEWVKRRDRWIWWGDKASKQTTSEWCVCVCLQIYSFLICSSTDCMNKLDGD